MSQLEKKQIQLTTSQLKEFDGKEGRPAYIAYKGVIYDVSKSPLWKKGNHPGAHTAGNDLTMSIMNAPHTEELLMKFEVVGELIQEGYTRQKFVNRIQKLHMHSMVVHFSLAYSVIVPLLAFLFLLTREVFFEFASYFMLLLGLLAGPVAGFSGIFSWKVTYESRMTKVFSRKILLTFVLVLVIFLAFVWRTLDPNILINTTSMSFVYLALSISLVPLSVMLGNYGGKIVFL